jgi:D-lactate dehydrogenase (cytochrome)
MKMVMGKDAIRGSAPDILYDESRFSAGVPSALYYPETESDIREALVAASRERKPVCLIGGQTGITGGAAPSDDSVAISFAHMHSALRVIDDSAFGTTLICQPGVTLAHIAELLEAPHDAAYAVEGLDSLEAGRWMYPPDPTEMTAQLGGTVATNASGARSFRHGPTRNHVVSARIALAGGDTIALRRGAVRCTAGGSEITTEQGARIAIPPLTYASPAVKNASGLYAAPDMDLLDLFIGSEGTLGVFTEIGVRLSPAAPLIGGLSFFDSRDGAFRFAEFLRDQRQVEAIEYFDATALGFIEQYKQDISLKLPAMPAAEAALFWEYAETADAPFEDVMESWEERLTACDSSFDQTWSGFEPDEQQRLKVFRHAVPELVNFKIAQFKRETPAIRKIGTDTAVPGSAFAGLFSLYRDLIARHNLLSVVFGHLGDYHLHFNLLPRTEAELRTCLSVYGDMMEAAIERGGTVSAEHGVGKIKTAYLEKMYGAAAVAQMRAVKLSLDPDWRLNPGNLFSTRH